ncbi:hypothetical protein C1H46_007078 [Malus baccata]|uniref:Uncharacterized protein n=1 Tax=Malus baccata TaxID=106549 RepID=A0A540N8T2_MALBA|nr:hypothetical protein C1H46_007078 [Malus baccata]
MAASKEFIVYSLLTRQKEIFRLIEQDKVRSGKSLAFGDDRKNKLRMRRGRVKRVVVEP